MRLKKLLLCVNSVMFFIVKVVRKVVIRIGVRLFSIIFWIRFRGEFYRGYVIKGENYVVWSMKRNNLICFVLRVVCLYVVFVSMKVDIVSMMFKLSV